MSIKAISAAALFMAFALPSEAISDHDTAHLPPTIVTVALNNVDDVATLYVNGVAIFESRWGVQGPIGLVAGANYENRKEEWRQGNSGTVDITRFLVPGDNTLRIKLWNIEWENGASSISVLVMQDGEELYSHAFNQADPSAGWRLNKTLNVNYDPAEPIKKVVNIVGNWTVFGPCTLPRGCIFGNHKITTTWECDDSGLRHGSSRPYSTVTGGGGYTIDTVSHEQKDKYRYGVGAAIFYFRNQPSGSNPVQAGSISTAKATIIGLLNKLTFESVLLPAASAGGTVIQIWAAMAASRPEILGLITTKYDVVCDVDNIINIQVQHLQHFQHGVNNWGFSNGGWRQISARRLGSQAPSPSTLGPGERIEYPAGLFGPDTRNGVYTLRTHDAVVVTD